MKNFTQLNDKIEWSELLSKIDNDRIALLNKSDEQFICAWDAKDEILFKKDAFNSTDLQAFIDQHKTSYIFGMLSYDIKNSITKDLLNQKTTEAHDDALFFVPNHVLIQENGQLFYFGIYNSEEITAFIRQEKLVTNGDVPSIILSPNITHDAYIEKIKQVKDRIQYGDIYEMNYCMHFVGTLPPYKKVDTKAIYRKLYAKAQAPFGAYFRTGATTILCASPERFINKKQQTLTSQPIKGTAKRSLIKEEDDAILTALTTSEKERAENIMIVDLVRNDLSMIAERRSVNVPELCKAYSFKTVHQLISTVKANISKKVNFTNTLEALFPMGSMTGAPKKSAMQHIHAFENFDRGIYSGSVGYIAPNGNYDFNVVIRSIIIDENKQLVTSSVGGAITIKSDPEEEYQECLVKLNAIKETLS
ncbi:anthranilate synthase component I family protein [Crocinitomix catalasitica]|uniref:anthranilate synthase component I family protein n=1 Tax=Crocinitomix catalasitica TaxID=184607 RepID=UPI0006871553|nr:anthranilate synthase component I family protein [Crocinitomix catalasitica]